MLGGLNKTEQYRAVLERDKKYDGLFVFVIKNTGVYCRPSCPAPRPLPTNCLFFDTTLKARLQGYQACQRCHPDRLKNDLWVEIVSGIEAGAISDKGVRGLADSLHISERHLRRIVRDKTGISPSHLNQTKRLSAAQLLITQTKLPIIDVAFIAEFSSLRQFNAVFKSAFKISPRQMRKNAEFAPINKPAGPIAYRLPDAALFGGTSKIIN